MKSLNLDFNVHFFCVSREVCVGFEIRGEVCIISSKFKGGQSNFLILCCDIFPQFCYFMQFYYVIIVMNPFTNIRSLQNCLGLS